MPLRRDMMRHTLLRAAAASAAPHYGRCLYD